MSGTLEPGPPHSFESADWIDLRTEADARTEAQPEQGRGRVQIAARGRLSHFVQAEQYLNSWRRWSVSVLKYTLPILALVVAVVLLGWGQFYMPEENGGGLSVTQVTAEHADGGVLGLTSARFYGHDQNGNPFTVTAEAARHDKATLEEVDLIGIQADITLHNGVWITFSAPEGYYSHTDRVLMLDGGINIFSDRGYEFFTDAVLLDLTAGVATSEAPILGQGPFGLIKADRFRTQDMGKRLFFNGNVFATLYPAAAQEAQMILSSEGAARSDAVPVTGGGAAQ